MGRQEYQHPKMVGDPNLRWIELVKNGLMLGQSGMSKEEEPEASPDKLINLLSGALGFKKYSPAESHGEELMALLERPRAGAPGGDETDGRCETVGSILMSDKPVFEDLLEVKNLAKANLQGFEGGGIPRDVAAVIYNLAVAKGRAHGFRDISGLDDQEIDIGSSWVQQQDWLTSDLQKLSVRLSSQI